MPRRNALVRAPLLLPLLLAACATGSPGTDRAGNEPPSAPEGTPASAGSPEPAARPARPVAVAEGALPTQIGGTRPARLEVTSLGGSGRLVTATLRIVVPRTEETELPTDTDGFFAARGSDRNDASGLALVDTAAGERLPAAADASGACACTTDVATDLEDDDGLSLTATFAAPSGDATRATLEVPGFGSVADVPIRR